MRASFSAGLSLLRSISGVTPMLNRVARHRVNRDRDQSSRGRISGSPATQVSNYEREYGQQAGDEILSDREGNICRSDIIKDYEEDCSIPNGITIGESDIPVSVDI